MASSLIAIGLPQVGQKPRSTRLPLSPITPCQRSSPSIWTALFGTTTMAAKALPLARWQSRQWQFSIVTGSASALYRTAPQEQSPESVCPMPFPMQPTRIDHPVRCLR